MVSDEEHGKLLAHWAEIANKLEDLIDFHEKFGLSPDYMTESLKEILEEMKHG